MLRRFARIAAQTLVPNAGMQTAGTQTIADATGARKSGATTVGEMGRDVKMHLTGMAAMMAAARNGAPRLHRAARPWPLHRRPRRALPLCAQRQVRRSVPRYRPHRYRPRFAPKSGHQLCKGPLKTGSAPPSRQAAIVRR